VVVPLVIIVVDIIVVDGTVTVFSTVVGTVTVLVWVDAPPHPATRTTTIAAAATNTNDLRKSPNPSSFLRGYADEQHIDARRPAQTRPSI
jgi:hypothetical protein